MNDVEDQGTEGIADSCGIVLKRLAALLKVIYSQDRNFSSQIEPWCLLRLVVNAELTQNFVRNLRNQQTVTVC